MSKKAKALGLPIVNDRAAGIDIGSRIQVAAVPPELSDDPVRTFQSFTGDIERMADWLVSLGVKTVAMESTGLYWIPVYEILEDRGLTVVLANARDCKAVPGRKSPSTRARACTRRARRWRPGVAPVGPSLSRCTRRTGASYSVAGCCTSTRPRYRCWTQARARRRRPTSGPGRAATMTLTRA